VILTAGMAQLLMHRYVRSLFNELNASDGLGKIIEGSAYITEGRFTANTKCVLLE